LKKKDDPEFSREVLNIKNPPGLNYPMISKTSLKNYDFAGLSLATEHPKRGIVTKVLLVFFLRVVELPYVS